MISDFAERLPPGIYETSFEELERKLGWSDKRRGLIGELRGLLEEMRRCGVRRVYK